MKKIMAVLAAGVVFIALAMTSCSDPIAEEEGPTVTLYFGGNPTSRAVGDPAVYPYTPIGGDGCFHNRIKYKIEFYQEGATPSKYQGTAQPVKTGTATGGEKATIQLSSHGKYDVYVEAFLDDTSYAVLNTDADGVTGTYPHLTIDTTKTISLTAPMKVINPVFWDAEHFEAITEYIGALSPTSGSTIHVAVELTPVNWKGLINAIDSGATVSKKVDLDLSHCTMPNHVFDPDPENAVLSAGKAKISKITLPLDAKSIAGGDDTNPTFRYFTSLTEVNAPSVTTVGDSAFEGCTSLTTVSLLKAETIGESVFYNCTSLVTVDLPEAKSIGNDAFYSCTSLTTVSLLKAETIGNNAFRGCNKLTDVSFTNVKTIGDNAFYNCTSLLNVDLLKATSIGVFAFSTCTSLKAVSLHEAKSIGESAFDGCTSLETLSIPKVETIAKLAFQFTGTTALSLYLGKNPPILGNGIFASAPTKNVNIYIPHGADIGPTGYGIQDADGNLSSDTILDTTDTTSWLYNLFLGSGSIACTFSYY